MKMGHLCFTMDLGGNFLKTTAGVEFLFSPVFFWGGGGGRFFQMVMNIL